MFLNRSLVMDTPTVLANCLYEKYLDNDTLKLNTEHLTRIQITKIRIPKVSQGYTPRISNAYDYIKNGMEYIQTFRFSFLFT